MSPAPKPITALAEDSEVSLAPAADVQQRLWFLAQLDPESPAYNIPTSFRVNGRVDVAALEQAINHVVLRHEALRTTFTLRQDQLMQVIAPALHVPLSVADLRLLDPADREAAWRRLVADEGARVFDLERGPLLRAMLVTLGPLHSVLHLTVHHIVFDGWSGDVFVRELAECYSAIVENREPALPDLAIQYADFVVFQRDRSDTPKERERLREWCDALSGSPTSLNLPTDHPRPPVQRFRGGLESAHVSSALWQSVGAFSRLEHATVVVTLLAAFGAALRQWSKQEVMLIGCPVSGRDRPELESLIGFFVNTLVLRVDASGDPTFRELVGRVRAACQAAYENHDVPFDSLVERLNRERTRERHPVFQVMFTLDAQTSQREFSGLELERVVVHNGTTKCDLTLDVATGGDGAALYAEYSLDLFESSTIAGFVQHFQHLLGAAVAAPDRRLSELPAAVSSGRETAIGHGRGGSEAPVVETRADYANEIEAALSRIWSEVLGVRSIAPTDNFFDLGGHSLLAITLANRIRDRLGRQLPIATLFDRPTIRGLAEVLSVAPPPSPSPTLNAILHSLSPEGSKTPIVLMHGTDGSPWGSQRLARHLGVDRSVYGLQTTIGEGDADALTVEAIAASCVSEIRTKVPSGPCHLGAFCVGAKIAVEVARQLRSEQREVGLVVVLDYAADLTPLERSFAGSLIDFARNLPLWIRYDMIPVGPGRITGRARSKLRLLRSAVQRRLSRRQGASDPDVRDVLGMWRYTSDQAKALAILWRAFERYTLQPYPGRVVLFRPRAEPLFSLRYPRDLGWTPIATGGLDVVDVPGSHETMLEEAFLPEVARQLSAVLDRADQ